MQLGSLKIFNYYFKVILGENDSSLSSKIPFEIKSCMFYNFFSIWEGINTTFEFLILSDKQSSILREEFKNISLINISHELLEILDYIETTNLAISKIIHNNLKIVLKLRELDNYIYSKFNNNKCIIDSWEEILDLFRNIPSDAENEQNIFKDLKSINKFIKNFSEFYIKLAKAAKDIDEIDEYESFKMTLYIQDSIKYLHSVGRVLYDPGLNVFGSKIKKIIPEIEKEIKKLS